MAKKRARIELEQRLRENGTKIELGGEYHTLAEIYRNDELKEKLVEEKPEMALHLYSLWGEYGKTKLGRLFVSKYNGHPEHGGSAFHIAGELGISGVQRPPNPVTDDVEKYEQEILDKEEKSGDFTSLA